LSAELSRAMTGLGAVIIATGLVILFLRELRARRKENELERAALAQHVRARAETYGAGSPPELSEEAHPRRWPAD
jgi:hypothetical protein